MGGRAGKQIKGDSKSSSEQHRFWNFGTVIGVGGRCCKCDLERKGREARAEWAWREVVRGSSCLYRPSVQRHDGVSLVMEKPLKQTRWYELYVFGHQVPKMIIKSKKIIYWMKSMLNVKWIIMVCKFIPIPLKYPSKFFFSFGMGKFPGLNPCHSSDLSHSSDNAKSLTTKPPGNAS